MACGIVNGPALTDDRPDPEPRGHARHALHHPRDRHRDHRRRAGRAPASLPDAFFNISLKSHFLQRPVPRHRRGRGDCRSAPTTCARSAPAVTCTRSDRTRTPRGSSGSPWARRVFTAFVVSGGPRRRGRVCCGPRSTARSTRPRGTGYELQVIAAVVIGGVAIFGGQRQRGRRGARRVAAEHDPLAALYVARRVAVLDPGDRGDADPSLAISIDLAFDLAAAHSASLRQLKEVLPLVSGLSCRECARFLVRWETGLVLIAPFFAIVLCSAARPRPSS